MKKFKNLRENKVVNRIVIAILCLVCIFGRDLANVLATLFLMFILIVSLRNPVKKLITSSFLLIKGLLECCEDAVNKTRDSKEKSKNPTKIEIIIPEGIHEFNFNFNINNENKNEYPSDIVSNQIRGLGLDEIDYFNLDLNKRKSVDEWFFGYGRYVLQNIFVENSCKEIHVLFNGDVFCRADDTEFLKVSYLQDFPTSENWIFLKDLLSEYEIISEIEVDKMILKI